MRCSYSYSGKDGPEHWGDLQPEFHLAKDGKQQSPIDLTDEKEDESLPDIQFRYEESAITVVNNGHSIQCDYDKGSFVNFSGKEYELKQFHFHTPSEHAKHGEIYPMEGHLVHEDSTGHILVLGLLFENGPANSFLDTFWGNLPEQPEETYQGTRFNVKELLPEKTGYFSYQGSLTTPPCSEGVKWLIMSAPVNASPEQMAKFTKIIGENARPLQPINNRKISKH